MGMHTQPLREFVDIFESDSIVGDEDSDFLHIDIDLGQQINTYDQVVTIYRIRMIISSNMFLSTKLVWSYRSVWLRRKELRGRQMKTSRISLMMDVWEWMGRDLDYSRRRVMKLGETRRGGQSYYEKVAERKSLENSLCLSLIYEIILNYQNIQATFKYIKHIHKMIFIYYIVLIAFRATGAEVAHKEPILQSSSVRLHGSGYENMTYPVTYMQTYTHNPSVVLGIVSMEQSNYSSLQLQVDENSVSEFVILWQFRSINYNISIVVSYLIYPNHTQYFQHEYVQLYNITEANMSYLFNNTFNTQEHVTIFPLLNGYQATSLQFSIAVTLINTTYYELNISTSSNTTPNMFKIVIVFVDVSTYEPPSLAQLYFNLQYIVYNSTVLQQQNVTYLMGISQVGRQVNNNSIITQYTITMLSLGYIIWDPHSKGAQEQKVVQTQNYLSYLLMLLVLLPIIILGVCVCLRRKQRIQNRYMEGQVQQYPTLQL